MELSSEHVYALNVAADYDRLKRYFGILPKSMAMHIKKKRLDELVKGGYLEKLKVVVDDDVRVKGYKITPLGLSAADAPQLPANGSGDAPDTPNTPGMTEMPGMAGLSMSELDALNDIYHFSQLCDNKGVCPKKTMPRRDPDDIDSLCDQGYIFRIKVRWADGKKLKGYIASPRGEIKLRSEDRI